MKSFLLSLLGLAYVASAQAQDTCKVFGQKNPHGVAMEIRPAMTVVDTVNFSVRSMKTLPYNISATDTIFFDVCIKARDGKMHTTQVRYGSTHGTISYNVSMQAPSTAGVGISNENKSTLMLYPNPAKNFIQLRLDNSPSASLEVIIIDQKGTIVNRQFTPNDGNGLIQTFDLSNGKYHATVKSGNHIIGSQEFVILK